MRYINSLPLPLYGNMESRVNGCLNVFKNGHSQFQTLNITKPNYLREHKILSVALKG